MYSIRFLVTLKKILFLHQGNRLPRIARALSKVRVQGILGKLAEAG